MIRVRLEKDIEIPGFSDTWKLIRLSDGRVEASGFASPDEALAWAPKWGCEVAERRSAKNAHGEPSCKCGHSRVEHDRQVRGGWCCGEFLGSQCDCDGYEADWMPQKKVTA